MISDSERVQRSASCAGVRKFALMVSVPENERLVETPSDRAALYVARLRLFLSAHGS